MLCVCVNVMFELREREREYSRMTKSNKLMQECLFKAMMEVVG